MTKHISAFLVLLALLVWQPDARASTDIRMMVSDLRGQGVSEDLASTLTDLLVYELSRDASIEVMSDSDIRATLTHVTKQTMLGCDEACWVDLARQLDCTHMVHGSVGKLGHRVTLNITVIESSEGGVVDRFNHTLFGRGANWMSTIEVTAQQLMGAATPSRAEAESDVVRVDLDALSQLRTAQRPKVWNVSLSSGAGFFFAGTEEAVFSRPLYQAQLTFDHKVVPWLSLGAELGGFTNALTEQGVIFYGDTQTGMGAISRTEADTLLRGAHGALRVVAKPSVGWWVPYVGMGLGMGYLDLELGDSIPRNQNMPQFFTLLRSGSSGSSYVGRAYSGYQMMIGENFAVNVELSLFRYFNEIEYEVEMDSQSESDALYQGKLGNLSGASLLIGLSWQE